MDFKRINIISGHYGSGKTNIAVNLALELKKLYNDVALVDIDIVNPYFRSKDSEDELTKNGIRFICSPYANSNVDIPALPQEMYAVTDDKDLYSILDVGGDERGALALGRVVPEIKKENNYQMLYVVNFFRPLTADIPSAIEVMREIEDACGLNFSGIIHNSNLGNETKTEDYLSAFRKAEELSCATDLPIVMNTVNEKLYDSLKAAVPKLYPIKLQIKL